MNDHKLIHDRDWYHDLRDVVDELNERKAALLTEQDIAEWTSDAALRDMTERQ